ncbi:hypothetical protein AMECASPLE_024115 [Ameca splendens]|uniref:Secreted protein n=1 Tax=Ameca splendens TaxID=208324 RepID=A0ABV1A122_9TELE
MCILVPVSLVSIIVAESSLLCHFFAAQRSAVFMELLCHLVCCFVDVGVCLGAAPSCFCSAMEAITAQEDFYSPKLITFTFNALSDQMLLLFKSMYRWKL